MVDLGGSVQIMQNVGLPLSHFLLSVVVFLIFFEFYKVTCGDNFKQITFLVFKQITFLVKFCITLMLIHLF